MYHGEGGTTSGGAASGQPADGPQSQYAIEAGSSLQERRPRRSSTTTPSGCSTQRRRHVGPGSPEGLYHRDTRYLSHLDLRLGGKRPMLLSSTVRDDNARLTCDLTNPDFRGEDGNVAASRTTASTSAARASCGTRPASNAGDPQFRPRAAADLRVELALRRRFRGSVRGARHAARTQRRGPGPRRSAASMSCSPIRGLDDKRRQTRLRFRSAARQPSRPSARCWTSSSRRAIAAAYSIEVGVRPAKPATPSRCRAAFFAALPAMRRRARAAPRARPRSAPPTKSSTRRSRRSVADLYMLIDRDAGRALSLCRHPLVQHGLRPRRHDHRAADAVARPDDRPRRAALSRRRPGDRVRPGGRCRARQDPARDAPRRDGANSARCRSAAITAASIRRRCS